MENNEIISARPEIDFAIRMKSNDENSYLHRSNREFILYFLLPLISQSFWYNECDIWYFSIHKKISKLKTNLKIADRSLDPIELSNFVGESRHQFKAILLRFGSFIHWWNVMRMFSLFVEEKKNKHKAKNARLISEMCEWRAGKERSERHEQLRLRHFYDVFVLPIASIGPSSKIHLENEWRSVPGISYDDEDIDKFIFIVFQKHFFVSILTTNKYFHCKISAENVEIISFVLLTRFTSRNWTDNKSFEDTKISPISTKLFDFFV